MIRLDKELAKWLGMEEGLPIDKPRGNSLETRQNARF